MPESTDPPGRHLRATRAVRREIGPMLALAGPVVLAEVGWLAMGFVDTIMVGRLGGEAIGAVGIGTSLFGTLAVFGMGLLLGLDTLVSQAFGAGDRASCDHALIAALYLSALVAPPLILLAALANWSLAYWGLPAGVLRLAVPYFHILTWSLLPLLVYAATRRYLQAMNLVAPVTFALVSANLVNAGANWVLVFGHLGMPALGTPGSAIATLVSRIYMAGVLVAAVLWQNHRQRMHLFTVSWRIDRAAIGRLLHLGLPAAAQVTLELGVFAAVTVLAGRVDETSLAAHQIVLILAWSRSAWARLAPFASVRRLAAGMAGARAGRDGRRCWSAVRSCCAPRSRSSWCRRRCCACSPPTAPSSRWARRCWRWPPRSNSSTGSRACPPASCAALATPVRR
jgi:MATE family multidrug resistance protein